MAWILRYVFITLLFTVVMVAIGLALFPAKPYVLPALLAPLGVTPGTWASWGIVNGIPLAAFLVLAAVAFLGRASTRRYILILIPIGAVLVTGYQAFLKAQPGGWPMSPPGVVVQTVTPRLFQDQIEAIGTTQANESTSLTSNVTETVADILFTEGQFVTKDTVLVQLHDDQERASLVEAEKAFNRAEQLKRTSAVADARVDAERARLEVARAQVRDRKIVAPFDGVLGLRSISVGGIVNPGTVITTIDDVDPIKLEFSVPESYLSAVKTGMMIEATSDAYRGVTFRGQITAIDPRIDPITRSLRIKAEIANEDGRLRAGMLLVTTIVNNARESLAVSEEAFISQGAQKSVMVVETPTGEGDQKVWAVTSKPVTIGTRMAGYAEVTSGLKSGDQVIVDGVVKAKPGEKVRIVGEKSISDTVRTAIDHAVPGKQDELAPADNTPPQAD